VIDARASFRLANGTASRRDAHDGGSRMTTNANDFARAIDLQHAAEQAYRQARAARDAAGGAQREPAAAMQAAAARAYVDAARARERATGI
jgi:hypothetical protein